MLNIGKGRCRKLLIWYITWSRIGVSYLIFYYSNDLLTISTANKELSLGLIEGCVLQWEWITEGAAFPMLAMKKEKEKMARLFMTRKVPLDYGYASEALSPPDSPRLGTLSSCPFPAVPGWKPWVSVLNQQCQAMKPDLLSPPFNARLGTLNFYHLLAVPGCVPSLQYQAGYPACSTQASETH